MRGYFGLGQLSAAEKSDILNQHKSVYNGYQTMQPQVSNTQPLTVYDFAGDKEGLVVNNKGEVKKYTNMGINEQVEIDVLGGKTKGKENDFKKLRKDRNEEKDMVVIDVLGGKTKDEEKNFKNLRKDRTEQIVIDDVIIGKTNPKEVCDDCGAMIMDGMCSECGSGYMEESYLEEGNMCEQCGGTMKEDVCEQCGSGKMEEETGHLDDIYKVRDLNLKKGDYDYVEGGGNDYGTFEGMHKNLYKEQNDDDFMDYESSYTEDGMDDPDNEDDGYEDMNASEVTDGEMDEIDIKDLIKGKKYKYKTPVHQADIEFGDEHEYHDGGGNMYGFKGGDTGYSLGKKSVEDFISNLDDEELYEQGGNVEDMDDDDVQSAYDFESNGPGDVYPVNEFDDDVKEYEQMESAYAEDELEEGDIYGDAEFNEIDVSGVQGIYGAMDRAYDFDSGGPGKAGPYQEFSYESELDEEDDFEEVDEDLKESFLIQKNKINEMFNRFSKYN
jgi:hypothetical protein